jgi:hypothetical protein
VPPSVAWGIGIGLIIAAIDTLSLVVVSPPGVGPTAFAEWPIADLDFMANILLYSLIGFRVGRSTAAVRDAAEAGVLAGVLVGVVGIAATMLLRPAGASLDSTTDVISVLAQNVALGGVLAIISGWLGARAAQGGPAARS